MGLAPDHLLHRNDLLSVVHVTVDSREHLGGDQRAYAHRFVDAHLHSVSVLVLLPLLVSLWCDRRVIQPVVALLLAIFLSVMVVVNVTIAVQGMGVEFGWIDHLFLALAAASVEAYYLLEERATAPFEGLPASDS